MGREGEAAPDAVIDARAGFQPEKALGRSLAGDELAVALVDVAGEELSRLGVRSGDDQGRHAANVGGKPRRVEIAYVSRGGDQHLPDKVAALLDRKSTRLTSSH